MNRRLIISQTTLFTLTFLGVNGGIAEMAKALYAQNFFFPAMTPVYAADTPDPIPDNLQGTTWYISGGSEITPLANVPVTIQFTDKDFSGNASCNNFRGTYTAKNNSLSINPMIRTTRKACPEAIMAQEQQFVQVLPNVQSYAIDAMGILTLTYNNNTEKLQTLSFIPESQFTPLHNTQWQLVSMAGEPPIADNKPPSLNFSGKSLSGSGGCNRLIGQFTVDGNQLSINEKMASTMMACPEPLMAQEQKFVQALITAREYVMVAPGNLVITYGEAPGQELRFTPVPNPAEIESKTPE